MEASRLPPGQILTRGFPVVGERESPTLPSLAQWDLVVDSGVDRRAFSWRDIKTLQSETLESDIHCVTSWTRLNARFTGIRLKDFLEFRCFCYLFDRSFATERWLDHVIDRTSFKLNLLTENKCGATPKWCWHPDLEGVFQFCIGFRVDMLFS